MRGRLGRWPGLAHSAIAILALCLTAQGTQAGQGYDAETSLGLKPLPADIAPAGVEYRPDDARLPDAKTRPRGRDEVLQPYTTFVKWTVDCRYKIFGFNELMRFDYYYFQDPSQDRKFAMDILYVDGAETALEIEFVMKDRKALSLVCFSKMEPWQQELVRDRQAKAVRGPTCHPVEVATPQALPARDFEPLPGGAVKP